MNFKFKLMVKIIYSTPMNVYWSKKLELPILNFKDFNSSKLFTNKMKFTLTVLVILFALYTTQAKETLIFPNTVASSHIGSEINYFKLNLTSKNTEQVWIHFNIFFDERTLANLYVAHESLTTRPTATLNHWNIRNTIQSMLQMKDFDKFNTPIFYFAFEASRAPIRPLKLDFVVAVIHSKRARLSDGETIKGRTENDAREPLYIFQNSILTALENVFNYKVTVKTPTSRVNESLGYLYLNMGEFPSKLSWRPIELKSPITSIQFSTNRKNVHSAISTKKQFDFELTFDVNYMILSGDDNNLQLDYKRTDSKYQYYRHHVTTSQETYIIQKYAQDGPKIEKFYANVASNENPTELDHEFSSVDVSRDGEYWGSYIHLKDVRSNSNTKLGITQKKGEKFFISNSGGMFYTRNFPLDFKLMFFVTEKTQFKVPVSNGRYKFEIQLLHEREVTLQQFHLKRGTRGEYVDVKKSSKDFIVEVVVDESREPKIRNFFNLKGDNVVTVKMTKI
jgi:hypothetical protein